MKPSGDPGRVTNRIEVELEIERVAECRKWASVIGARMDIGGSGLLEMIMYDGSLKITSSTYRNLVLSRATMVVLDLGLGVRYWQPRS